MKSKTKQREPISGVYKIIYRGAIYIGSSIDVYKRFKHHERYLKAGTHQSKVLQKEYSTHAGKLKFQIIIECNESVLSYLEYTILRNCEKRGIKLWNSHGTNSKNGNPEGFQYIYAIFR